jgi:pantothenate kinase-related protein Tda10
MTGVRPAGSVERQVEVQAAHDVIVAAVRIRAAQRAPLLVAFDGGSGAGKTTLSGRVAATLQAALVPSDDFYAAHITDAEWAQHSPSVCARLGID